MVAVVDPLVDISGRIVEAELVGLEGADTGRPIDVKVAATVKTMRVASTFLRSLFVSITKS